MTELRAALRLLPAAEMLAVVLHDGEDCTAEEVAGVCGCSTNAAHKRLQRGRTRLVATLASATGQRAGAVREDCTEARGLASAYLEGRLGDPAREQLEEHLRECAACPPVLRTLQGIATAMSSGPDDRVPERLLTALHAEIASRPS